MRNVVFMQECQTLYSLVKNGYIMDFRTYLQETMNEIDDVA